MERQLAAIITKNKMVLITAVVFCDEGDCILNVVERLECAFGFARKIKDVSIDWLCYAIYFFMVSLFTSHNTNSIKNAAAIVKGDK